MSSETTIASLYRRAACVRAVAGGAVNQFSRALDTLRQIAEEAATPLVIVGGLAAIHHGVPVITLDVDVVVAPGESERFLDEARQRGLTLKRHSAEGWHRLVYHDAEGDVEVEVIPAGKRAPRDPPHAPSIPTPQELGVERGLGFASFADWVAMKLVANRDKDRYHLVEALRRATPDRIALAVQRLRGLDPSYLREFERLLQAAEAENSDRW
ncbi:MAG: hypothetical protein NUV77_01730 [Thermoguttaceae bacterium]|jgi:stage V sporulation protein SpoVS|nr:hypothetical protein [Thermoguttaceae bacterium]